MKKKIVCLLMLLLAVLGLAGCSSKISPFQPPQTTLRVVSGSENQELEEILEECQQETGVQLEMDYLGSVDIMRTLEEGAQSYDVVWPASSLWISMGDTGHIVKHTQSISRTPIVFGIRQSLAQELGFTEGNVSVSDILKAIEEGRLSFCMTSATQSNSGAMAYLGFINALLGKDTAVSMEDLDQPQLQEQLRSLLSGIERSSGSSDWLKDMFLRGNYDAMVNYECLIISANQELEAQGQEPLYVVYPYDGLAMADSPMGYLDHGDPEKEEAFLKVQEYLLSEDVQEKIQATGRRTGYGNGVQGKEDVFRQEWGIDTERILSSVPLPSQEVIFKALNLYQSQLKKPSLTVYCLDYSASMEGEGREQLEEALAQILIQENAQKNLLQAGENEVNIVLLFDSGTIDMFMEDDPTPENLEHLYEQVCSQRLGGNTDIYNAVIDALFYIQSYDLSQYTPAIILMTDGMSNGNTGFEDFAQVYDAEGLDVPVFSIMFGSAVEEQLEELADYTNGRVFDGTKDLIQAFRSVKGYN